jgi:hypothetical protein
MPFANTHNSYGKVSDMPKNALPGRRKPLHRRGAIRPVYFFAIFLIFMVLLSHFSAIKKCGSGYIKYGVIKMPFNYGSPKVREYLNKLNGRPRKSRVFHGPEDKNIVKNKEKAHD